MSTVMRHGQPAADPLPTDDPAGPSLTLLQRRAICPVATEPFPNSDLITVQTMTGKTTTDLCAALAP